MTLRTATSLENPNNGRVCCICRAFRPGGVLDSRCLHPLDIFDLLLRPAVLLKILIRGRPEPPVTAGNHR
eukprot:896139-Heterocapsa_arctica.AAC.1